MDRYVKICPKCKRHNAEGENDCLGCGYFLGLVRAVASPVGEEAEPEVGAPPFEPVSLSRSMDEGSEGAGGAPEPGPAPPRESELYLDCQTTPASFAIKDGNIVGQAHPTSRADVQLSNIPNLNFVSRHHCRFHLVGGYWFVTALPDALNPTTVNQLPVAPGGRVRITQGDELVMANVPFRVRIVER